MSPTMSRPEPHVLPVVPPCAAEVRVEETPGELRVILGGAWHVTREKPDWFPARLSHRPVRMRIELANDLRDWDSSLLLFVHEVRSWADSVNIPCELGALPDSMRGMLAQFTKACEKARPADRSLDLVAAVGLAATEVWHITREIARFLGECVISATFLSRNPNKFRLRDCLEEMQQCGAMALPIVGLIGLLVGLILAYQAAVLMRQFGADIYVADAVGLAMVREMGAMMTAVILAGRTGAAFAATLGNMRANDEIDAFETLGIRPVDFLVIPKLVSLALMMPLLTLYANCMGILGGMFVSLTVLDIPPAAYWVQTISAIDLSDVASGVIKSAAFGILVGLAGCHRGLLADRSSTGVGRAATSAVVIALLLIILADAFFAVAFNILGI
jgi:phospholipid/cholesterol/gamma-HCH transport system permease protein